MRPAMEPSDTPASLLLRMFRRGHDTCAIARMTGLSEAAVELGLHKAKASERARDAEWAAAGEDQ